MPRRLLTALALIATLAGCAAPKGLLVEYRDGITPITRPVKHESTCVLVACDQPGAPLTTQCIAKGGRVGFQREPDGSVTAVSPGYAIPLPPGAYAWEVVAESVPTWREWFAADARETRASVVQTVRGIPAAIGAVLLLAAILALGIAYGIGQSNTNRAR